MEVHSFEIVIRALNEASVQYLVVGGLAVNAHGFERLTKDIDLVIGLHPENIERGLKALASIDYQVANPIKIEDFTDSAIREGWRKDKNMVVLKLWSDTHRRTPIDVFVYEPFDFQKEYEAALWVDVSSNLRTPMVGYKALIQMKKDAGRPQDFADIEALTRVHMFRDEENDEQ